MKQEIQSLLRQSLYILIDVEGAENSLFNKENRRGVLRVDPVLIHGLHLSGYSLLSQELISLETFFICGLLSRLTKEWLFGANVTSDALCSFRVLFLCFVKNLQNLAILREGLVELVGFVHELEQPVELAVWFLLEVLLFPDVLSE